MANLGPLTVKKSTIAARMQKSRLIEFDWGTYVHELAAGGETIVGTPALDVLKKTAGALGTGSPTTDLSAYNPVLDPTFKKVQFRLTDISAVPTNPYTIVNTVTLSGGEQLVAALDVIVEDS